MHSVSYCSRHAALTLIKPWTGSNFWPPRATTAPCLSVCPVLTLALAMYLPPRTATASSVPFVVSVERAIGAVDRPRFRDRRDRNVLRFPIFEEFLISLDTLVRKMHFRLMTNSQKQLTPPGRLGLQILFSFTLSDSYLMSI